MPKPVAGRKYTVVRGDNLSHIANAAYGNPRDWRKIWKANKTALRSGDPNLIFPGEILWVPKQVEVEEIEREVRGDAANRLPGRDLDDFTVIVDGKEIPVVSGKVFRSFDSVADGFNAIISWDPTNPALAETVEKLKPYQYNIAECYLGGELVVRGYLYSVSPSFGARGRVLEIEAWSFAADLVDCVSRPPYEASNITAQQRILDLIEPFAISLDFQIEDDAPIDKLTIEPTETIFNHLVEVARIVQGLLTSDAQGSLVVRKADAEQGSVYTLEEGKRPLRQASIRFDGRKRFNTHEATAKNPRKKGKNQKPITAVAKDDVVPAFRMRRFNSQNAKEGTIQKAADWERSRALADSLGVSFPVDGWQIPGTAELWREGQIVTVQSPTLFIPDGFDFLIRSVEYQFDESGIIANLELVPPQTFTGEPIKEPWI